jgi:hypothetical protein
MITSVDEGTKPKVEFKDLLRKTLATLRSPNSDRSESFVDGGAVQQLRQLVEGNREGQQ